MDAVAVVVIAVVAALVVVALLVLALVVVRRRDERRRQEQLAHADDLRGRAASHVPDVRTAAERAEAADAEATRARARADEAEQVAEEAHRVLALEQAAQEDVVREADAVDPRVDTGSDDYRPITGPDMKGAPRE